MSIGATLPARRRVAAARRPALIGASFLGVLVVALLAVGAGAVSVVTGLGLTAGAAIAIWMFASDRPEKPMCALLLYLGLLDGFLKLKTNSSLITLGRDALLYAVAIGYLARATLRRQKLRLPPLSGWILAYTVIVLVQVFNPHNTGIAHTLGGLRPHLEFVPLFFFGYGMVQTASRLRVFFILMLVIALGNGIVGLVQLNLTPDQLASWGPGYRARIEGTGTGVNAVSARVFEPTGGSSSQARTRPFGLGDDSGVGELWGMLAFAGALALVSLGPAKRGGKIALLLCLGPPLAIVSGEGRSILVSSVLVLIVYVILTTSGARLIPNLLTILVVLAAIGGVFAYIGSISGSGVFSRYLTITPSKVATTTSKSRGNSFAAIPKLLTHEPLGNGLGFVGPASRFAGGGGGGSDGETEPGFLLSELGVFGLIVYYGLNLHLLVLGATRIRRLDPEVRGFVAALLAGLVGLLLIGVTAATTATSPASPYLWLAGGAVSYWLTGPAARRRSRPLSRAERRVRPSSPLPDIRSGAVTA